MKELPTGSHIPEEGLPIIFTTIYSDSYYGKFRDGEYVATFDFSKGESMTHLIEEERTYRNDFVRGFIQMESDEKEFKKVINDYKEAADKKVEAISELEKIRLQNIIKVIKRYHNEILKITEPKSPKESPNHIHPYHNPYFMWPEGLRGKSFYQENEDRIKEQLMGMGMRDKDTDHVEIISPQRAESVTAMVQSFSIDNMHNEYNVLHQIELTVDIELSPGMLYEDVTSGVIFNAINEHQLRNANIVISNFKLENVLTLKPVNVQSSK